MKQRKTQTVGAFDAKTHFSELLERAASGEEITVTKHGTPVAKLVPIQRGVDPTDRQAAIARWRANAQGITLGGLKLRDLISEGRP